MKLRGNLSLGHDAWQGIFYMPSRIDRLDIYTKAFDYPVTDHWGKVKVRGELQVRGRLEPTTCNLTDQDANY